MPTLTRIVWRHAPLLVLATFAACSVPTEPRWERADTAAETAAPLMSSVQRFTIEEAPVVASTEFRSRIVPAVETVLGAPAAGRTVSRIVATGNPVAAGDPVLEWSTGLDDTTQLRIDILELQIELADAEGRSDDLTVLQTELAELRVAAERENTEVIVSPIDGVVGRYLADRSAEFAEDDPLVTVGDPDRTSIELALTEDAVGSLAVGVTLQVVDAQNRFSDPIPAVISDVNRPTGRSSGADHIVTAVLDQASTLAVGTRVIVNVDRRSDVSGRRVAADAVLDDGLGPFVMIEDETGWHRRDVEVGLATDSFVELLTDIPVGTTVVVP